MSTKSFSRKAQSQSTFARLFLLALGLLFATALTARAATFYVNDTASLSSAINQANTNFLPDTIILLPGNYTVSAPYGSGNAFPQIKSILTIKGNSLVTIERSALATGNFRFFEIGAIHGQLWLENVRLLNGRGQSYGGAILNYGRLTVRNCFLDGNQVTGAPGTTAGGAIYNKFGRVTLQSTSLRNNRAAFGGALCSDGSNPAFPVPPETVLLEISRSAFFENSTFNATGTGALGGGVLLRGAHGANIADTTFTANGAQTYGGALAFVGLPQKSHTMLNRVLLRNLTVTINRALLEGGGVYYQAGPNPLAVEIVNTILLQNGAPLNPDFRAVGGVLQSLTHNIIGFGAGFLTSDPSGLSSLGLIAWVGNPGNQPGGEHWVPVAGSLALDNGDPAYCSPTDQLGKPRVGVCDIGAVEKQ